MSVGQSLGCEERNFFLWKMGNESFSLVSSLKWGGSPWDVEALCFDYMEVCRLIFDSLGCCACGYVEGFTCLNLSYLARDEGRFQIWCTNLVSWFLTHVCLRKGECSSLRVCGFLSW